MHRPLAPGEERLTILLQTQTRIKQNKHLKLDIQMGALLRQMITVLECS